MMSLREIPDAPYRIRNRTLAPEQGTIQNDPTKTDLDLTAWRRAVRLDAGKSQWQVRGRVWSAVERARAERIFVRWRPPDRCGVLRWCHHVLIARMVYED